MSAPAASPLPRRQARRVPRGGERGAILVQTAIMLIGLTAMSAFVVDYGILWTARRQVQNAADAAAMAAAMSLAFEAPPGTPNSQTRAIANAMTAVTSNPVWGQAATMTASDVTFITCPAGAVGVGACVRVQVFRDQSRNSSMPTIFGQLVGVTEQGVRATATAQVLYGRATDCVKPLALPDRWEEYHNPLGPPGWDVSDRFERYQAGALLPNPDVYVPAAGGAGANGSGFSRGPTPYTSGDYGRRLEILAALDPLVDRSTAERFLPVRVDGIAGTAAFQQAITDCSTRMVQPGDAMQVELANINAPLGAGLQELINRDPAATWNPSLYGGRGGVSGGCMVSGDCVVSPRIIALPVYDPDAWDLRAPAMEPLRVSRLVGFFVEAYYPGSAGVVSGRLMVYPVTPRSSMTSNPTSSFVASVTLVR